MHRIGHLGTVGDAIHSRRKKLLIWAHSESVAHVLSMKSTRIDPRNSRPHDFRAAGPHLPSNLVPDVLWRTWRKHRPRVDPDRRKVNEVTVPVYVVVGIVRAGAWDVIRRVVAISGIIVVVDPETERRIAGARDCSLCVGNRPVAVIVEDEDRITEHIERRRKAASDIARPGIAVVVVSTLMDMLSQ